jgi:hypothetical protein
VQATITWEVPAPSLVASDRFGVGRGVEAITGVGTISTDAALDPDILRSPVAGFMVVVTQGFMVVAAMEGGTGKGGSWAFVLVE